MNNRRPNRLGIDTVVFVGHARLPQSLSPIDSQVIMVELEVDRESGLIVDLDISGALPAAKRLLDNLLIGKNIERELDPAIHEFQRRYVGPPQRALSTALSSALECYQRYFRQRTFRPFSAPRIGAPSAPSHFPE